MSNQNYIANHRCPASLKAGAAIRLKRRANLSYGPYEWMLCLVEYDFDWRVTYLKEACAITYCPYCGEKLGAPPKNEPEIKEENQDG